MGNQITIKLIIDQFKRNKIKDNIIRNQTKLKKTIQEHQNFKFLIIEIQIHNLVDQL